MQYPFRNLVFEGGGVKGIAYVGALRELGERGIIKNIRRVGGTSAGAINATLMALGYSLEDTKRILSELDFKNLLDDSWGMIRDCQRLADDYGWHKGDFFKSWIGERVRERTGDKGSTFKDIKDKGCLDLYVVGTNLSTHFSEVFSIEHTPEMPVAEAVRVSMSIPLFFAAVKKEEGVYVDGGVFRNYPIKLFDRRKYIDDADFESHGREPKYYEEENRGIQDEGSRHVYNKETLGFRLDSKSEIAMFRDGAQPRREEIKDFFDFAWALLKSVFSAQDDRHLHSDDWQRTVYIDTLGVGTTDFDLSDAKKQELEESGYKGVVKFFEWYDTATGDDLPKNHPDYREKPVVAV